MKIVWGTIASAGLLICIAGFVQLTQLITYFVGNQPYATAPALIGIGLCVFAFARTWMLITWRRRRFARQTHTQQGVVAEAR